jgi:hypothetical protein
MFSFRVLLVNPRDESRGESKVDQFQVVRLRVFEHEVLWLNVSVANTILMDVIYGIQYLPKVLPGRLLVKHLSGLQSLVELLSLHELLDQEELALGLVGLEQSGYVRMVQLLEIFSFVKQLFPVSDVLFVQVLDRSLFPRSLVNCLVHLPKSALSDLLDEAVIVSDLFIWIYRYCIDAADFGDDELQGVALLGILLQLVDGKLRRLFLLTLAIVLV